LATLVELGVPWGQGYHLGAPDRIDRHRAVATHT
jgi:hypothetical protein